MSKYLIILGSAPCSKNDLYSFLSFGGNGSFPIMLVGLSSAVMHKNYADFMVTYHPNEIAEIAEKRKLTGGNTNYTVVTHKEYPGAHRIVSHIDPSGSSSLLGVRAGLEFGYNKIILCGCPLLGKNGHGRDYNKQYAAGWTAAMRDIKDNVRSMSGWTKQLLGPPTRGWLYD